MVFGNNAFQRRLDNFHRRRRKHVKIKVEAWNSVVKNLIKQRNIFFEPDALADFVQVFFAHPSLELRIVQQQISELRPLLHQVQSRHAGGFALELLGWNTDQFGQNIAGIVEGERLVEVAGENKFFDRWVSHHFIRLRRVLKDE